MEATGEESVEAKAVVEEKSEEKAKEKRVVSSKASGLDSLMDGQEAAQVSPSPAKALHQPSQHSTTKERYREDGDERQASLPFHQHNGRSLPSGNAPAVERYPPPRHFAPTRMPFLHNDRTRHYGPGSNYRPRYRVPTVLCKSCHIILPPSVKTVCFRFLLCSLRPNGSSHNYWKQRPADTYRKAAAHPGPVAAKAVEKLAQPAREAVRPSEKRAAQADGPTEGSNGCLQEAVATAGVTTAAQEVEEVAWPAEGQKAEEAAVVVVGNPWSSTSNVWHRRHVPPSCSPQAQPAAASDQVSLPEDGDNQRFVDRYSVKELHLMALC